MWCMCWHIRPESPPLDLQLEEERDAPNVLHRLHVGPHGFSDRWRRLQPAGSWQGRPGDRTPGSPPVTPPTRYLTDNSKASLYRQSSESGGLVMSMSVPSLFPAPGGHFQFCSTAVARRGRYWSRCWVAAPLGLTDCPLQHAIGGWYSLILSITRWRLRVHIWFRHFYHIELTL